MSKTAEKLRGSLGREVGNGHWKVIRDSNQRSSCSSDEDVKLMENTMANRDIKTIIIAINGLISSYYVPDCAGYSTWIISLNHLYIPTK